MQHIISPWLISFINVVDVINIICITSIVMLGVTLAVILIVRAIENEKEIITKTVKKIIWGFIVSLLLVTLIPSKNILIQMIVADHLTYNTVNKVIMQGKNVKNEIKKDIIDILTSVNKKEEK